MKMTNQLLSLWELAHRMAGENPYRTRLFGLPPAVKDTVRLLMNEILEGHLESTLIMEKRHPDSDEPEEFFIRSHIDDIYRCIAGKHFPRKLLNFVGIDRWAFAQWCQHTKHPLPDFWFGVEYRWPEDRHEMEDGEETSSDAVIDAAPIEGPDKLAPVQRTKVTCQNIAAYLWKESPDMTIADMVKRDEVQRLGGGGHYSEKTLRKWLSQVAPPSVKGRRGRPPKQ